MNIVSPAKAIQLSTHFRSEGKRVVLTGGCFDILHVGHVIFFEKAKAYGDVLFVFIESDEKVTQLKGAHRPINSQKNRSKVVSSLRPVDVVIELPYFSTDKEYENLVKKIKPAIIATTKGDLYIMHKQHQAQTYGGKVVTVTPIIENHSSSRLAEALMAE